MFSGFHRLKDMGIMGINSRNLDFIAPHNKRQYYRLVDDKVITKKTAIEAGIPVPELFATIEYQEQLKRLGDILAQRSCNQFVIKPAKGSGGGGIMVIKGRTAAGYLRANGQVITLPEIQYHISNILGGLYALGGARDVAIIEQCIENIDLFDTLAFQGVPDIRLVIYKNTPVMAMLRLPTLASGGRANLHSGGIGVGLSMDQGMTTNAILHNQYITHHGDTDAPLLGHIMPDWDQVLDIGVKAAHMAKLGYVGVDIVLDKHHGPMLLEINARPGISIQIANRQGLKARISSMGL